MASPLVLAPRPDVRRRPASGRPGSLRRRLANPSVFLFVILTSQLMVVLDATIVNVALPHIQEGLGFSGGELSWVLNAYLLTFGGLLLLGARSGDLIGRRRTFLVGIAIFSLSSLLGGFAVTGWMLLAARALQGVGCRPGRPVLAGPADHDLLRGPPAGAGHRPLHDRVGRRWRHRPRGRGRADRARVVALGDVRQRPDRARRLGRRLHRAGGDRESHGRFDIAGALTSTFGMVGIVLGLVEAGSGGWASPLTLGLVAVGLPCWPRSCASRPVPRSRSCRCACSPTGPG